MVLSEEQAQRYSRHFVLREIGVGGQKRLLQSKVLVIGAGGLGSSAIMQLAAAGVGVLGIADYDKVDLSNLQRQTIHRLQDVDSEKVISAKRAVEELNPDVTVQLHNERMTADNIQSVMEQYDFVLDCTDRFETKFLINDACVLSKKAYSHAGVVRFEGQAFTYVPSESASEKKPCLRCLLGSAPHDAPLCAEVGVLGAAVGVMGCIQATEAVKFLLGRGELLTGRVLRFDGLTMRVRVSEIPHADRHCAVCGENPAILTLADNREEYAVQTRKGNR